MEDDLRGGGDGWSWTINSGQFFYVCGGGRALGGADLHKSCERHNFKTGSWDRVLGMTTAIKGAPFVADGKRNGLYVVGGESRTGATNSLQKYDASRNEWRTSMASMRKRRRFPAAALFGADGMVVCGGADANWFTLRSCEKYLFDEDRWTTFAPLSQARLNHGMVNFKGRLYVLGGGLFGTIEKYDATFGEWRVLDNCHVPKRMDDFATLVYYE